MAKKIVYERTGIAGIVQQLKAKKIFAENFFAYSEEQLESLSQKYQSLYDKSDFEERKIINSEAAHHLFLSRMFLALIKAKQVGDNPPLNPGDKVVPAGGKPRILRPMTLSVSVSTETVEYLVYNPEIKNDDKWRFVSSTFPDAGLVQFFCSDFTVVN